MRNYYFLMQSHLCIVNYWLLPLALWQVHVHSRWRLCWHLCDRITLSYAEIFCLIRFLAKPLACQQRRHGSLAVCDLQLNSWLRFEALTEAVSGTSISCGSECRRVRHSLSAVWTCWTYLLLFCRILMRNLGSLFTWKPGKVREF